MAEGIGDAMEGAFIVFAIICIVLGAFLVWFIPVVWDWIKPFLHSITA